MRILITGVCGFVGSVLARSLMAQGEENLKVMGLDNLSRPGSEGNRAPLNQCGVEVIHADLRLAEDVEDLPSADWVIDAAAQPSVLAGLGAGNGSRRLLSHNLVATINILEYCKRHKAGLVLLSTSRVYSVPPLASMPVTVEGTAFKLNASEAWPTGISQRGLNEEFSTGAPISLYGATKLASECLALEYSEAFDFPVWINRCGVLAGGGQFGRPDQGIAAFWIHSYRQKRSLEYIGFGGQGLQVRDFLHPMDLVPLLLKQFAHGERSGSRIFNLGGGISNAISLRQLSEWCRERFGPHEISTNEKHRPYDIPWMVMDSARAKAIWDWHPLTGTDQIFAEIAQFAEEHEEWLDISK